MTDYRTCEFVQKAPILDRYFFVCGTKTCPWNYKKEVYPEMEPVKLCMADGMIPSQEPRGISIDKKIQETPKISITIR